jgi:hypothetical protein
MANAVKAARQHMYQVPQHELVGAKLNDRVAIWFFKGQKQPVSGDP